MIHGRKVRTRSFREFQAAFYQYFRPRKINQSVHTPLEIANVCLNRGTPALVRHVWVAEHLKLPVGDEDFNHGEDVDSQLCDDDEPKEMPHISPSPSELQQVGGKGDPSDSGAYDSEWLSDEVLLHGLESLVRRETLLLSSEAVLNRNRVEGGIDETGQLLWLVKVVTASSATY
jgi:hypothetical protein